MSRPVAPRETYEKDVQVIMRILQAVMADERHSQAWKKKTEGALRSSVSLLLNPENARVKTAKVA